MLLRLHADHLAARAQCPLPPGVRVLYVREGDARVRAGSQAAGLGADSAWHGKEAVTVVAGSAGATLLRWEIGAPHEEPVTPAGPGIVSTLLLAHDIEVGDLRGCLVRCDRVDFPPGGIAYTHVHRGPGIRCLLAGGLRVEVNGSAHDVRPGEAWFEAGPDPVLATASASEPAAFVRVMVLPRELLGQSSIRYVKPEDADKPKPQRYRVFVDEPISPRS